MNGRPDRPLVVKCTFDRWNKRITFSSARNCSYNLLKNKVEQCFSLYAASYAIAYKDDDGEVTDITTDSDLTEAIQYFQAGNDDPPTSSTASILSGRSFGSRKITLRVHITVDYDGPSLSDTSSLASMDEYKDRSGSQLSLSFSPPGSVDLDDDSVTVSSRDAGLPSRIDIQRSGISETLDMSRDGHSAAWESHTSSSFVHSADSGVARGLSGPTQHSSETVGKTGGNPFTDHYVPALMSRYPEDPSAVFERLKLQEAADEHSPHLKHDRSASKGEDRGAAWLRDQNARTIKSMLGVLPEPSEFDGASLSTEQEFQVDELGGDLALHRDPRGKYYYSYTSASSSAPRSEGGLLEGQSHDSGYDDGPSITSETEEASMADFNSHAKSRPTSMQLTWLASQQKSFTDDNFLRKSPPPSTYSRLLPHSSWSDQLPMLREDPHVDTDIPPEVLQFLPVGIPPSDTLTDCSECGVLLDSIRYVCSACGENTPVAKLAMEDGKGKGKKIMWGDDDDEPHFYPPRSHRGLISSSPASSRTVVAGASSTSLIERFSHKPLPSLPYLSGSTYTLAVSDVHSPQPLGEHGYELCSGCIESAGVNHALEVNLTLGTSPGRGSTSPSSPEDAQRALSQWRRSAPKQKGQLRHAFLEKVWAHRGWEDVEQDGMETCKCSTCDTVILNKRYKCASCQKFNLCIACYSQVHDIHPSHAFLVVPDKLVRSRSEPDPLPPVPLDPSEQSMTHPGVKCAHCMLDIVGARFHCAICDSVDICSNCESAGLPGNLDSSDDSHNSSHIMIKIPYPLETTELQTASRRAANLWSGRDAPNVLGVGSSSSKSKPSSVYSSYARTVIGTGKRNPMEEREDDHHMYCNGCKNAIFGIRYQCGSCPSLPSSYNLCSSCELRSYAMHDPMHIYFKLFRPVRRQLESPAPFLPDLYKAPAGPAGVGRTNNQSDPKDYLKSLVHPTAVCDCCVTRIHGEWFRCAYCPKDLCDACEALDTHDDSHVFFVFKGPVDMNNKLRQFAELDNPNGSPPVIPYPIYR